MVMNWMNWIVVMCVILSVLYGCRPNQPTAPGSEIVVPNLKTSDTQPVHTQPIRIGDSLSEYEAKLKASSVPFEEWSEAIGVLIEYMDGSDGRPRGLIFPDETRILLTFKSPKGQRDWKIDGIRIGEKGVHWTSPAWSQLSREVTEFHLEDFATKNSATQEGVK